MLEELRIRDVGVIDDAVLPLHPGLTVVTGETGAGKTMVVTGLGLLLGQRADPGLVRAGRGRALVEGTLRVAADGPVAARVREAGGELDDDHVVLARSVAAEGRSRAHVGGTAAPVTVLRELADDLVAVHGQADQQRLLLPTRVRELLDRYAGRPDLVEEWTTSYAAFQVAVAELAALTASLAERAQEADLLRFGLDEVASAAPEPGEDVALAAEESLLAHADELQHAAVLAHDALQADDGRDAGTLVGQARRTLDGVRHHDPALAALADRIAELGVLASELATDLSAYAASVDTDPTRLTAVGERRAVLAALTRRHGPTIDDTLAWAQAAAVRLAELDDSDDRVVELTEDVARLRDRLAVAGRDLSAARLAAAGRLGAAVTQELAALAMPHAVLTVAVRQHDEPDGLPDGAGRLVAYGPYGLDTVELWLQPHRDAPARPVAKGASGGELSRVMLALEVVLAGVDPVPTFVFDEVDAGVGGKAAVEVGRRLARLARHAQVLVVTHLPQVAAFADRHLVVTKTDDGVVTASGIATLDDAGRARELTRMLAGLETSDLGLAHAEELLAVAAAAKAGPDVASH